MVECGSIGAGTVGIASIVSAGIVASPVGVALEGLAIGFRQYGDTRETSSVNKQRNTTR